MIADERHHDDIGPRRHLRDRKHVGELPVAHPMHDLDGEAMHFGQRGVGAADRKQRQQGEIARQGQQCADLAIHRRIHHASAMLQGISTPSTQ